MAQQPLIYYAVLRERGENWNARIPMRQQEQWEQRAAFMTKSEIVGLIQ